MMKSMRESLEYFSREFSPFQYRQMRILEFPTYATFAQSFANTVPYSEGIGFVLDQRDAKSFDVVYYVTSHEVAHQWWGHQLLPSPNQGWSMLVESFAQYSALIALEAAYGEHQMRRFLKYELDRYLTGRASEPVAEKPLYRNENQQYIHYRKGSVVMYELRDRVGEQVVNRSLARFLEEWAGKTDPYPRTVDYLKILREEAGPEHNDMITDMFEKIVLYDLRTKEVEVTPTDDGKYTVSMTVSAAKLEADEKGEETEVTLGDGVTFDVGVFSEDLDDVYEGDSHVLHMQKHLLKDGEQTIEIIVDEAPVMVGVDPYNKMIDRQSDDNVKRVTVDELAAR
ncbi:MAG: M1 family aminopeptidase, partial [Myxococcota bacterium]